MLTEEQVKSELMRVKSWTRELTLLKNSNVKTTMSAPNQCKDEGHGSYDYEIKVTATEKLDDEGFIIDHTLLHKDIEWVAQNEMGSCEELCQRMEAKIAKTLNQHGVEFKSIDLMIKPEGSNAWVRIFVTYVTNF
jgi:6-pyruvoyl-tetrahydropterin synthase